MRRSGLAAGEEIGNPRPADSFTMIAAVGVLTLNVMYLTLALGGW
jgi:hypothetical protein